MVDIKKIDNMLYASLYGVPKVGIYSEIWEAIKENSEILKQAITVCKDKFGESDQVLGLAICDSMLIDYNGVNKEIYQELVNTIYSNQDIARIVQDGASNGGYSYLLMTLWNPNLVLTEEQKAFAVDEALNKIGTKRYYEALEKRSMQLDKMGVSDNDIVLLDIDGCKNPMSTKSCIEYFDSIFGRISRAQAHGSGVYDIRYWILANPNWTVDEKKELIYEFYGDDKTYTEYLEEWEWGIINEYNNFKDKTFIKIDMSQLYYYTYEELLEIYADKETVDKVWNDIMFCRLMNKLRPKKHNTQKSYVKTMNII